MQATQDRIKEGNRIRYPDGFPDWIRAGIEIVMEEYPDYCLVPKWAEGSCVFMTDKLLFALDELNQWEPIDGYMPASLIGNQNHAWAKIGEWNVDLTYRQFDVNSDCPKIWRSSDGLAQPELTAPIGDK